MKIFNQEEEEKKVYVQPMDLILLGQFDVPFPKSVEEKISDCFLSSNVAENFIEFQGKEAVDFFEKIDWILDYKQLRNLSNDEIKEMCYDIAIKRNAKMKQFQDSLSKRRNYDFFIEADLLDYQKDQLEDLLLLRLHLKSIPFPLVPDSDGFSYQGENLPNYELKTSLDPNKLLLSKVDGKPFSASHQIPHTILDTVFSYFYFKEQEQLQNFCCYLSGENHYIVIEAKEMFDKENSKLLKKS